MHFIKKLFSRKQPIVITTSVDKPLRIKDPEIGYLNLLGAAGEPLIEADKKILNGLFKTSHESKKDVPLCQVLFLYCSVDSEGNIAGAQESLRAIIKKSTAFIAVVASDNLAKSYIQALEKTHDWRANIALVVDRKAEKFALFYKKLFEAMFKGTSMPLAWIELAPQAPQRDHVDAPTALMVAEAGHLTFMRT